jgi:hypothetical protein
MPKYPQLSELPTKTGHCKVDSLHYPTHLDGSRNKHTLSVPNLLDPNFISSKLLFPRGIFSKVKGANDEVPQVKRIEVFARKDGNKYGIIRSLFVGFSSEKSILRIAEVTSGVVQVTAVRSSGAIGKISDIVDKKTDTLIVKRSLTGWKGDGQGNNFRLKIPTLAVPYRWKDRMALSEGDCLIVSNPIADFAVPPPNL